VYAARTNDEVTTVDLPLCISSVSEELARLYSPTAPVSIQVDAKAPWQALLQHAREELRETARRGTYAHDVWTRYASLRNKSASDRQATIAIAFGNTTPAALPADVRLLASLSSETNKLELLFDNHAINALHAERIGARVVHLMAAAAANPNTTVGTLPIVPETEQALLLQAFQQTHCDNVDVSCIHELFAAQVQRTPDQTALVCRDQSLTYRELHERSDELANHLLDLGVGPDRLVAIAIERSLDMVVGLLAILKAGGAYVPLDPSYPTERLAMMLEDSGAQWLLTQRHLRTQLPKHDAQIIIVDDPVPARQSTATQPVPATPEDLAYVIFTSGSTGRPKGVMIEHRNVANFFAGMDERVGVDPGIWLAVTSISFDISVLEIFWTLCRGFETVIQEEGDKASMLKSQTVATDRPMGFGLFYFAADSSNTATTNAYRLMLDGAKFADTHDFVAVWTPERHFHAFGGLYPNPAVTSAAIASITSKVELRAGSVVLPLHDPIRVAEEWAVVDNISQGRVGLSFASGWHVNDFVLKPENFERRREVMQESIDTVLRLWAGEKIKVPNGAGEEIEVSVLPRPIRPRPPMWMASAGNIETFRIAGRTGFNVLTNMLGQDLKDLETKFAAYREARREAGHEGDGIISVMLHTFVTDSDEKAKEMARKPFGNYLTTSYDLVKVAPWMFPAFKQPSTTSTGDSAAQAFDPERFDDDDMAALLDHAFDRYFDTAGLFGTPQRALKLVEQLKDIGATEVACLIDFGIDPDTVLENLEHLDALRQLANPAPQATPKSNPVSIREQFDRRQITHFQCTPSLARILIADGTLSSMKSLRRFLVGGEALTTDLAQKIITELPQADLVNMYGPTETTIWSTTEAIDKDNAERITIGKPIANTQIRILDSQLQLMPLGTPGELCIGGNGVVRGYLERPDLTAERFVPDPFLPGNRIYRTGDLARFADDGTLEYLGRLDQQVKFNGYRIELGEIETVLQKHPAVHQAVVAVKGGSNQSQLVGYVLPAGNASNADQQPDETIDWQRRWDTAYATRSGANEAPARFNTAGWLSSYTGEPIATSAMREWLDQTISSIRDLSPQRVLEIGCGTGMILYSCLEHVEHYTAVDVSPVALESIRNELNEEERRKVSLLNQAADQLDAVADNSCDVVIINSVAQYFPHADYLTRVLTQAARVLSDGGSLFLGDVRCLEAANVFHALVELHKAPGQTPAAALAKRTTERETLDTELLLAKQFFATISRNVPRLSFVSMQNKRGTHPTEMRDFRYDVVLRAGAPEPQLDLANAETLEMPASTEAIQQALANTPSMLRIIGAKDARLDRALVATQTIARGETAATAESLCAALEQPSEGIDPDHVRGLHSDYTVELRFGDEPGSFDALLRHKQQAPAGAWLPTVVATAPSSNTPHKRLDSDNISAKLRAHLQDFLPDYMVPQAFVMLESLPLTPNGKIDRKALPNPVDTPKAITTEYAVPGNDLERTIAKIWQGVLDVERVGRKDNIFDLGASSLLTVEANSQLQEALGQKIPLVTMFRYPTIESLAGHLDTSEVTTASIDKRQDRMASAAERRRQARSKHSRS
jgi:natural product biosynthesis luciferase-like monooxygenase protein